MGQMPTGTGSKKAALPPKRSVWADRQLKAAPVRTGSKLPAPTARLSSAPVPAQHAAPVFDRKQSEKKAVTKQVTKREPVKPSLSVRDQKTCKQRPDGLQSRKPGGGTAKRWVPWCGAKH